MLELFHCAESIVLFEAVFIDSHLLLFCSFFLFIFRHLQYDQSSVHVQWCYFSLSRVFFVAFRHRVDRIVRWELDTIHEKETTDYITFFNCNTVAQTCKTLQSKQAKEMIFSSVNFLSFGNKFFSEPNYDVVTFEKYIRRIEEFQPSQKYFCKLAKFSCKCVFGQIGRIEYGSTIFIKMPYLNREHRL